eukprot:15476376-Alexandrium_andersonii.AAC.1
MAGSGAGRQPSGRPRSCRPPTASRITCMSTCPALLAETSKPELLRHHGTGRPACALTRFPANVVLAMKQLGIWGPVIWGVVKQQCCEVQAG